MRSISAVGAACATALVGAALVRADDFNVSKILTGVDRHYNSVKTLEVAFTEKSSFQGRTRTEKGELYLRKPGRMRWDYTQPAGKLFVSDGKYIYMYTPNDHHYERMPMKETEDMRAPLAFLLGRLNFFDDFRNFKTLPEGRGSVFITADPKSDKMPYRQVTFLVSPNDSVIHWLRVRGQDGSELEFVFEAEKENPVLKDGLFKFDPPPGAEVIESHK
ncbi:MAG TPA: outer membrane lipoprotein carrier protein LolA [Bryobacteraceae bacterium]|nr:outer membrane lipoprotein carrier protein LolA [Bryobacteraceae bacterium]